MFRKLDKIPINTVLPCVEYPKFKDKINRIDINGDLVNIRSKRLFTFKNFGIKCRCCGLEGKYFLKEKNLNDLYYHLNLYGLTLENKEEMLTHDHKIPLSRGGKNNISNMQTLCNTCNFLKNNSIVNIIELKKIKDNYCKKKIKRKLKK